MSKVSIEGNASGTGTFTIASPNSNTNRTLTLPDSTGTLVVSGTTPSLNGIAFPATQSASADANTLDDYEEGTWTPTDASGAGLTLTVTGASYVKIGKQVTAWLWVTYPSTANGSGAVIGGLPFNVGASPMNGAAIAGYTSYTEVVTGIAIYTTSSIELYRDGGTSVTNANLSTKELRMCVTYTV